MIKKDFIIVFHSGGFAGDLITALHNPNIFKNFNDKTVVLDEKVTKLKSYNFRIQKSFEEKIEYLKSIEDLAVCSSHDLELALRLKDNTTFVYCSDSRLVEIFFNRIVRDKDDMKMTMEEYINWQDKNKGVFKKQIDIANITDINFLDSVGITDARSVLLLKQWINLNNFVQK